MYAVVHDYLALILFNQIFNFVPFYLNFRNTAEVQAEQEESEKKAAEEKAAAATKATSAEGAASGSDKPKKKSSTCNLL